MPDLRFIHDDSFDEAARLDALIDAAPKGAERTWIPVIRMSRLVILLNEKRYSCCKQTPGHLFCRGGQPAQASAEG